MSNIFETLGLLPELAQTVEQMGFEQPTGIQQEAIPLLLEGRNIVGQAQTGTGKTAAFALPMLQNIAAHVSETGKRAVQALVLAPTRELAIQVAEAAGRMAHGTSARVMAVYGGQSYGIQLRQLERGVDVVVGTPGRLLDLLRKGMLDLSQVRYLVLDEADEMLEMGFIEDVETILGQVPEGRQIALFSATMPEQVRRLAERYASDAQMIRINPTHMTVQETEQRFYRVREENKLEALTRLLEVEDVKCALIFARTKARAQELSDELARRGYPVDALHGDLSQQRREYVLNRFRKGIITLLVATDVAARGLDIENVSHVINIDPPGDGEDYVHRIGRTGRAGRKGVAITFFHPRDRARRREIEAYTRQAMIEQDVPTREVIQARRDERFIERLYEQMIGGGEENERALVERLVEANLDLADIAAAAIRMARRGEAVIPEGDINEPRREGRTVREKRQDRETRGEHTDQRKNEPSVSNSEWQRKPNRDRFKDESPRVGKQPDGTMIRLRMNLGEAHGLRPGDVVGAIASEVGIPGRAIGEIAIHHKHTFVDVSEKHVRKVLQASSGQYQLRGRPVILTLAG